MQSDSECFKVYNIMSGSPMEINRKMADIILSAVLRSFVPIGFIYF